MTGAAAIQPVDPASEQEVLAGLAWWRTMPRRSGRPRRPRPRCRADAARPDVNLMEPPWPAPGPASPPASGPPPCATSSASTAPPPASAPSPSGPGPASSLADVRDAVRGTAAAIGAGRLRLLLGKPGLDGHSNGVEQIAVRARDAGFEVIYSGIRLTPEQIAAAAAAEDVHCVGLSVLSGGHAELVPEVLRRLRAAQGGGHPRRGRRDHPARRRRGAARPGRGRRLHPR